MKILSRLLLVLVIPATIFAENLSTFQQAYQKALTALHAQKQTKLDQLGTGYSAALERQMATTQRAGDLEATLEVKKEITRFAEEKSALPEDQLSPRSGLRSLQSRLLTAQAGIDAEFNQKGNELLVRYVAKLDGLITQLTIEGNIDQAIAVRNEREQLSKEIRSGRSSNLIAQSEAETLPAEKPEGMVALPPPAQDTLEFQGRRYKIIEGQMPWEKQKQGRKNAEDDW